MVDDTQKKSHVDRFARPQKELREKGLGFSERYKRKSQPNTEDADNENFNNQENNVEDSKQSFTAKYSNQSSIKNDSYDLEGEEKKKFSDLGSVRRTINKKNFADAARKSRLDCIFLVRGKDGSRDAWHYVLVDKSKKEMFLAKSRTGSIDVSLYGEILHSGWGKDPPAEIVKKIEEEFGV